MSVPMDIEDVTQDMVFIPPNLPSYHHVTCRIKISASLLFKVLVRSLLGAR